MTKFLAVLILTTTAAFAEAPVFPGAEATGCDPDKFTPIFGKSGDVLYWNNPTCPNGQGGMDPGHSAYPKPAPVVDEEPPVEEELPAEA